MSESRPRPEFQDDGLPPPTRSQKTELRDQPPTSDFLPLTFDMSQIDQSKDGPLPPKEPSSVPPLHLAEEARFSRLPFDSPPTIPGYEILGELGHGGMGVVYQARQISLGRIVALKMIRSIDLASRDDRLRFQSEAEMVACLKHPNIVAIYEVGVHEGRPYFSLEYVEGGNLAQRVRGIPQAPRSAAEMVETLARAVHAAHQRGIIHRDLKPANVLLQRKEPNPKNQSQPGSCDLVLGSSLADFEPQISDFGLAKRLDSSLTTQPSPGTPPAFLTQTGAVMGTPSYMAPEQAAGRTKEITPAVDIYSLGAILYELCTGRPPFLAESWDATRDLVLTQEPVPPRRLQPKLPRDLQTICLKCLEKEPRKRFASALELADELRRFLDGKPIRSRPVSTMERVWSWTRRKPAMAGLTAFAGLTLITAIIVFISLSLFKSGVSRERQIRNAFDALDKGIALCEEGKPEGMLLLARSLELAPEDAEDLQFVIRSNLGGWGPQISPLKGILADDSVVLAVAFSPDGKKFLTGSLDGTAQLWETATGQPIGPPLLHRSKIWAVAFSPDDQVAATGGDDNFIRLWHAATGQPISVIPHPYPVYAIAFSPDGKTILTGYGDTTDNQWKGGAQLWNSATREAIGPPFEVEGAVLAVAFSPDGKTVLTGSDDKRARLWNLKTREKKELAHDERAVWAVAFSPNGQMALTGGQDHTAHLWNVGTGNQIGSPFNHYDQVKSVAFAPDGLTFLSASGFDAQFWDVASGRRVGSSLRHPDLMRCAALSPDGKTVVTGCEDKKVRLWKRGTGSTVGLPMSHGNRQIIWALAISRDGKVLVTGSRDGTARLWEVGTGRFLNRRFEHKDWIEAVAVSPDGKTVLTGSNDKTAKLWEIATSRQIHSFSHQDAVFAVGFSPDGKSIFTASFDKTAKRWDAATGKQLDCLDKHEMPILAMAVNPNGKNIVTASEDKTARIWDLVGGKPPIMLPHQAGVHCLAFSKDGQSLLTGSSDGTAQLWKVSTGERSGPPLLHDGTVYAVAISVDGKTLLTAGRDKVAKLWEAGTGRPMCAPLKQGGVIRRATLSPDGRLALTASEDSMARFWDTVLGMPIGPSLRHSGPVWAAAFSPSGGQIVTASADAAQFWAVPAPMEETSRDVVLWAQVITGMKLGEDEFVHMIDANTWNGYRLQLVNQGSPPGP
jgi:WD40 repeat protein/serine/threonine protein kinase